jgi:hypothetical protein
MVLLGKVYHKYQYTQQLTTVVLKKCPYGYAQIKVFTVVAVNYCAHCALVCAPLFTMIRKLLSRY